MLPLSVLDIYRPFEMETVAHACQRTWGRSSSSTSSSSA
jgi:hypothetical protein